RHVSEGVRLLVVGSGSGILAIVALLLGAKAAVGTDLDPCASEAVADNCLANNIATDRFKMLLGNIITSQSIRDEIGYDGFDIVTANILTEVLVPLTPVIVPHLKKGGLYITSGILSKQEDGTMTNKVNVISDAIKAAGMEVLEVTYQGEWASVTARKPL
ncbi:MAG: 50S ribosomal protein L11 methyltransferase, partial [Lachnospiraceae bacterium]|nr:50S ribosomal protein L11 methyltransferase [Lachnospiraceae bacterium]